MSDIYLSLTETPAVVTLSQPVISGALSSTVTVANTVTVALDANSLSALENVTVTVGAAISGTVTVANFPASQTVQGTVTVASLPAISGSVTVNNFPSTQTIAGTVTANVSNSVTVGAIIGPSGGSCLKSISPTGDAVRVVLAVRDASNQAVEIQGSGTSQHNIPIYGTVTIGNSVTIGSLPAISGTVTANVSVLNPDANDPLTVIKYDPTSDSRFIKSVPYFIDSATGDYLLVNNSNQPLPISGTVTANLFGYNPVNDANESFQILEIIDQASAQRALPVMAVGSLPAISGTVTIGNSVTIGSLPAISGTVTANNPSGALTTRFGSVATANLAFITSAVTNTSRKYLLAQNISAGTVTIGIGFSPTTTQGIQLTAGAGLTFDAFCPTGAVYWLGAVTGAAWTILEG